MRVAAFTSLYILQATSLRKKSLINKETTNVFKIQFKRKRLHLNTHYSDAFHNQYADDDPFYKYSQEEYPEHYSQESQYPQEIPTCLFCDGLIGGSHLAITTKTGEHCMHPSCIVSGFSLIINGFGLFMSFLFKKNRR